MEINFHGIGLSCFLLLLQFLNRMEARRGLGPGEQDWGYVEVRKGSQMFYWLHYTTANVSAFAERPLVIWLQGGPGIASTGTGCFEQLGAIDIDGKSRESNWVQHVNVLFIDSPVGTGYSYVEPHGRYVENNTQIALDLVTFMKSFLIRHKKFESVPLHIFSESYGGKMAPEFALELHYAKERHELRCNLRSVVVGNPWTSPLDTTLAYAPYLLQLGIVDQDGYASIAAVAAELAASIYAGKWLHAMEQSSKMQEVIATYTGGVFLYNTQRPVRLDDDYRYGEDPQLRDFMLSNVTEALGLTHMPVWMAQNATVFIKLGREILKPAVHIITKLLDETQLRVGVYSGILDLLCATPGTVNWINRMQWRNKHKYMTAPRLPFRINDVLEGYQKEGGRFSMFWVYRAGHLVQQDNPAAMAHILRTITNFG
ncbi:retinoid-inducible serine carboxypeptidase-like [Scaptodrosophila lebanonensis]|uniref:Carboxypeptidase n=1 Tax=Drosophila lebanonensis TaxID=7225 RepID=A0A6J2TGD0_DROLE|nr:retinoid-inducible serine carboxypeptidase-like [Scaptodrosophila lebanonensis]